MSYNRLNNMVPPKLSLPSLYGPPTTSPSNTTNSQSLADSLSNLIPQQQQPFNTSQQQQQQNNPLTVLQQQLQLVQLLQSSPATQPILNSLLANTNSNVPNPLSVIASLANSNPSMIPQLLQLSQQQANQQQVNQQQANQQQVNQQQSNINFANYNNQHHQPLNQHTVPSQNQSNYQQYAQNNRSQHQGQHTQRTPHTNYNNQQHRNYPNANNGHFTSLKQFNTDPSTSSPPQPTTGPGSMAYSAMTYPARDAPSHRQNKKEQIASRYAASKTLHHGSRTASPPPVGRYPNYNQQHYQQQQGSSSGMNQFHQPKAQYMPKQFSNGLNQLLPYKPAQALPASQPSSFDPNMPYSCDPCKRAFRTRDQLIAHTKTHVNCQHCSFVGSGKVVKAHVSEMHAGPKNGSGNGTSTGRDEGEIMLPAHVKLETPEEIAQWISDRKRRYPTNANIEQRKQARQESSSTLVKKEPGLKRPHGTNTTGSLSSKRVCADDLRPICRYFSRSGQCINGKKCRYRDEFVDLSKPSANGGLLHRLLDREIETEHSILLQCIRYIVNNRFFDYGLVWDLEDPKSPNTIEQNKILAAVVNGVNDCDDVIGDAVLDVSLTRDCFVNDKTDIGALQQQLLDEEETALLGSDDDESGSSESDTTGSSSNHSLLENEDLFMHEQFNEEEEEELNVYANVAESSDTIIEWVDPNEMESECESGNTPSTPHSPFISTLKEH